MARCVTSPVISARRRIIGAASVFNSSWCQMKAADFNKLQTNLYIFRFFESFNISALGKRY
jgi:hypothetical protein